MADGGGSARIAGAAAFVSMADKGAHARIVWVAAAIMYLPVFRIVFTTVVQAGESRLLKYDRLCFQTKACDVDYYW